MPMAYLTLQGMKAWVSVLWDRSNVLARFYVSLFYHLDADF